MTLLHHQIESIQYWKVSHLKYPDLLPNSPDAMDVSHLQKEKVADKKKYPDTHGQGLRIQDNLSILTLVGPFVHALNNL